MGLCLGSDWLTVGFKMVDFPGVFTCRGGSPNDLEVGFVNPFTGGADTGGSLLHSKTKTNKTIDISLATKMKTKLAIQIKELPCVFLGENEVPVILFFFFSLSSRDVNSSSELAESSTLEGTERERVGVARDVRVLGAGRENGEEKGSADELSSLSNTRALFILALGGDFEWRVLHVLFTTILLSSSSSLSLTKTGESH